MSTSPARPAARALAAITLAGLAAAPALTGCGGAATPEAAAPEQPWGGEAPMASGAAAQAAPPASPEEAQVQLDQAEAELASVLGGPQQYATPQPFATAPGMGGQPGAMPPPPPASPPAPAPAEVKPEAKKEAPMGGADAGRAAQLSANPCVTACRALASMTRAADHLCGLAGEDDGRCSGARARVKSATDRVQSQCPACGP